MRSWSETVGTAPDMPDIVRDAAQSGLERAANATADKVKSITGRAAASVERVSGSVADEAKHASDNASRRADQVSEAMTEITDMVEKALHRLQEQAGKIAADIEGTRSRDPAAQAANLNAAMLRLPSVKP